MEYEGGRVNLADKVRESMIQWKFKDVLEQAPKRMKWPENIINDLVDPVWSLHLFPDRMAANLIPNS